MVSWPTRESTDRQFCLRTVAAFPSSWVTRKRTNAAALIGKTDIGTICQSESSYSRGSVLIMTRRNMTSSGDCFDHVITICQSESSYSGGLVLIMTRRNMTSSGDCFDHVITICQSESFYSRGSVLTTTRRNMMSSGDCFDHVIKLPRWRREMQNQLF